MTNCCNTSILPQLFDTPDKDPNIKDIETLQIAQDGNTIVLKGSVPSQAILNHIKDVAAKVDGTKAVDATQVKIAA